MPKFTLFFLLIWIILSGSCENSKTNLTFLSDLNLDTQKIYLIFRGTNSKQGNTAKKFNLNDSLVSHVGISYHNGADWRVFHVLNIKNDSYSDLNVESLDTFFNLKNNNTYYGSIWQVNNLNYIEIQQIKNQIENLLKLQIKFDESFSSTKETELYCSEFIFSLFNSLNTDKFLFEMHKVKLETLHSYLLKKDSLEYYPVDIFLKNENIKKVKEWHFY